MRRLLAPSLCLFWLAPLALLWAQNAEHHPPAPAPSGRLEMAMRVYPEAMPDAKAPALFPNKATYTWADSTTTTVYHGLEGVPEFRQLSDLRTGKHLVLITTQDGERLALQGADLGNILGGMTSTLGAQMLNYVKPMDETRTLAGYTCKGAKIDFMEQLFEAVAGDDRPLPPMPTFVLWVAPEVVIPNTTNPFEAGLNGTILGFELRFGDELVAQATTQKLDLDAKPKPATLAVPDGYEVVQTVEAFYERAGLQR